MPVYNYLNYDHPKLPIYLHPSGSRCPGAQRGSREYFHFNLCRSCWNRRKAVTGVNGLTCHVRKHRGRSKAAMKPANAQNGKGLSPLPAPILRFSVTIRKTFQNLKEPPCAATEERPSRGIRRVALGRIGKLVLVLVGDRPDEYEYVAGSSVLLSNCLNAGFRNDLSSHGIGGRRADTSEQGFHQASSPYD